MKKRLTEEQFLAAVSGLEIGLQTVEIARGVLVQGKSQADFAKALSLTRGAVSQAVNRVWRAHLEKDLPKGFARVTAVLPTHQAFIVKKWEVDATKKRESKE